MLYFFNLQKNLQICKKKFIIQLHIVEMFAKKCPKNYEIYIFQKPFPMSFQICKKKIVIAWCVIKKKSMLEEKVIIQAMCL